MTQKKKLTKWVTTEHDFQDPTSRILADGILITSSFKIIKIGKNVLKVFEYQNRDDLTGFVISKLTRHYLSEDQLNELLIPGYFEGFQLEIPNKDGHQSSYSLSGFNFGLFKDVNNLILLIIKPIEQPKLLPIQTYKHDELDEFIYSASHSLRGPLATLMGLINLLELRMNNEVELKFIQDKMRVFADKLDELLHKMICFAESDKACEFHTEDITLGEIGERLRSSQDWDNAIHSMAFQDNLDTDNELIMNGELVVSLLRNIRSFFYNTGATACEIISKGINNDNFIEIEFNASGIILSLEQKQKIHVVNFGYSEILDEPQFTNLYSAKKIALKLKGRLDLSITTHHLIISLFIPKSY